MNTENQTRDRLAKLLATENIDIVRSNVTTAAFDIKKRVLILPQWKEMSSEIEEMLMLHEVGHALFTTRDEYGVVFEEKNHLREYANIIEDVRIERKMKERYPGSRKSFGLGYRQLNDRDFFGVKDKDLNAMLFIDRINIYFKVGYNSGVKFSVDEQPYLYRVDKCETVEDVLQLAEEIYEFSKDNRKDNSVDDIASSIEKELEEEEGEDSYDEFGDGDDSDYEYDSESKPLQTLPKNADSEEDLTPQTTEVFDKKLRQLADENFVMRYFTPEFEYKYPESNIIDYRRVLSHLAVEENSNETINKFKSSSNSMVSYLIKEFEMKKSATSYKRAKIAKLGTLDSKKLYAYKLKDDLFRQVLKVQEGKKHGMIFLLDWSGSMSNCIEETIEQVINLAMFCQRIQIPYQVFAFTNGYRNPPCSDELFERTETGLGNSSYFSLLEFFSHKMTNIEFNKMVSCLLHFPWTKHGYGLNGTPLNEALLYMTSYVGKFIKENQVEKMSFITLTDGAGSTLHSLSQGIRNGNTYANDTYTKRINVKSVLRDPMTKIDYDIDDDSAQQTSIFLKMIKDRWNAKSIGFFLVSPKYRSVNEFIKDNMVKMSYNDKMIMTEGIVQSLRRQKYAILNNVPGRDEFYVLPSNVKIVDGSLDGIDESMSAGAISRQLSKMLNTKRTSRVVLTKFVEQIC